jgi:5'(3')-deoxyribonucleotidase
MSEPTDFVLGVDLDGVCADFYRGIKPLVAEWQNVSQKKLTRIVTFELAEWGIPTSPGGYNDFHKFALTQRNLFKTLKPMPGCPQSLRRLSKEGVRIRIITNRLFIRYFHVLAITQTIEWLDFHGIPYWDLCFMGEKDKVGADVYVEDSATNIQKLRKLGREVIIFANSTNRHLKDKSPRVSSWQAVEHLVMEKFNKWKKDAAPTPLPKNSISFSNRRSRK